MRSQFLVEQWSHTWVARSSGELVKMQILFGGAGLGLRFCFSDMLPAKADAAGLWATRRVATSLNTYVFLGNFT